MNEWVWRGVSKASIKGKGKGLVCMVDTNAQFSW